MARARVFKTAGKVRIIGPFTLVELLVVVGVFAFAMEGLDVPAAPRFILSIAITYGVWRFYSALKHHLPGAAARHLATWLSQADRYYPSKDPVSRPLVYRPKRPVVTLRPAPTDERDT